MSFWLVSSAATLLGIPPSSRYNCCRQPQLPVGATHIAWSGCCCYRWCRGGCLSDCFLVGHVVTFSHSLPLPTLSQAYPLISTFSNPTIGRKILGQSLEVCGLESSIWTEGHLPIYLPTVPLPLWGNSTSCPSEMSAACFQVSVSCTHYGWGTVILSHCIFYCKYATLWLNCLIYILGREYNHHYKTISLREKKCFKSKIIGLFFNFLTLTPY